MKPADRVKLWLLRGLLPKSERAKEEVAKLILPKSPRSIWLGWDDVDMGGKLIRRVGPPVLDEDVARKKDVEAVAMPIGEAGDMIYHNGTKWTALKAPATEKWLKHPGGAVPPEWADVPAAVSNTILKELLEHEGHWWFIAHWYPEGVVPYGVSGSGYITWYSEYIQLHTGTTLDSWAGIVKRAHIPTPYYSWDRRRHIKTCVYFLTYSDQIIWLISGYRLIEVEGSNYEHIGFKLIGGDLYGTVGDGTAEATLLLETLTAPASRTLECSFIPGVECRFYVDNVDKGALTTNLPSGVSYGEFFMSASVYNLVAANKYFRISYYRIFTEE